jgi:hypothetical protein
MWGPPAVPSVTSEERRLCMRRMTKVLIVGLAIGSLQLAGGAASAGTPTCSEEMGIANHGQHIVGDYVTGIGHEAMGWSPSGQVGAATAGGAAIPGAPGAHGHMLAGIAPGASFCTGSSNPGIHL